MNILDLPDQIQEKILIKVGEVHHYNWYVKVGI